MGPWRSSPARRRDRWLCFAIGVAVSLLAAAFSLPWDDISDPATGRMSVLPWLALAVVVALRLRGRHGARVLALAVGAVLPHAAAAAFLLGVPVYEEWRHERAFDAAAWRDNAETGDLDWPTRLTMADDLVASEGLRGMSRGGVLELLGPDDQAPGWNERELVYHLGPERGLKKIDSEWLVVRFGTDGRVADWAIVRD